MKPRRRKLLLALALLLLALGLLAFGFFPQEPLRHLLENRLRAALGPNVRVARLHVVPGLLRAEVEELHVRSAALDLDLPRARVQLSLGTFFGTGLSIEALEVEGPHLVVHAAGAVGSTGGGPFATTFLLRHLDLRDGQVVYDTAAGKLTLDGLQGHGGLGSGTLALSARAAEWSAGADVIRTGPIDAGLQASPALELRLQRLSIRTDASHLELNGALGSPWKPLLDLTVTGHVALSEVAAGARIEGLAGAVDVSARIQGSPAQAALQSSVKGEGLQVAGWPIERLSAELERAPGVGARLSLRADAQAFGGRVDASGSLAHGTIADGHLDAHGLDVNTLRRRLFSSTDALPGRVSFQARFHGPLAGTLATSVKADVQLQAAAQAIVAELQAEGTYRPRTHAVDAHFTLGLQSSASTPAGVLRGLTLESEGRVEGSTQPRVSVDWHGALDLGAAGAVPLRGHAESDGAQWHANAEGEPLAGHATVTATAVGTTFERLELQASELQLTRLGRGARGTLALQLDAHGPLAALDGQLSARGTQLALPSVDVGALRIDGPLHAGDVSLEIAAPDLGTTATGLVNLQRAALDVRVQDLTLERVSAVAGAHVGGSLSAQAHVEAPLDGQGQPRVDGQVTALELHQDPWSARATAPFAIQLHDERVQVDKVTLSGSGLELQLDGQADLRTNTLNIHPRIRVDLAALPPRPEWKIQGHFDADVTLTGRMDRPQAEGTLRSEGLELTRERFTPIHVDDTQLQVHGAALDIPGLVARLAGGTMELSGHMPLAAIVPAWRQRPARVAPDEAAALRLTWKDIDPTQIRTRDELLGEDAPRPPSGLAGTLELSGGLATLAEPAGHLTTPALVLELGDTTLSASPLDLRLAAGRASGTPIELRTPNGNLILDGTADLVRREMDASARGAIELRALSPLLAEAALTGLADVDVELHGGFDALKPTGSLKVEDGSLRLRTFGQAVTGLRTTLAFENGLLRVQRLEGELGGGTLSASGQGRVTLHSVADVDVKLVAKEVALRYPLGLRSRLNAELALTGRSGALSLGGTVDALSADYDLDTVLDASVFSRSASQSTHSPLLRSIALDLDVRVPNPARVKSRRNGFEEVTARGGLRFEGNLETPLPYGQLQLAAGGRLQLFGGRFRIESGALTYDGAWDAGFALDASLAPPKRLDSQTAQGCVGDSPVGIGAGQVDISVTISGTLGMPELAFRSSLVSAADAMSLVATGRCGSDTAQAGGTIAGNQLSSIFADRLTSGLRGGIGSLGLDEVTITPQLLVNDRDPGARFTFGKRLNSFTRLVYSTSLNSPEDRYIRLELGPWHTLTAQATRFGDDGTLKGALGQRIEWGGSGAAASAASDERVRVAEIVLAGDFSVPEPQLRAALHFKVGQKLTPWQLLDHVDALRAWLRAQGYLEAEAGGRFEGNVTRVQVRSGPRYAWRIDGVPKPGGFDSLMRTSLFEDEALERGRERLLRDLRRDGYLRADVRTHVQVYEDTRTLAFDVRRGTLVALLPSAITGADAIPAKQLVKLAGGERAAAAEPLAARERWQAAYRERYYLRARIDGPRLVEAPEGLRLVAHIEEGPRATLASIAFDGATRDPERLHALAALTLGEALDEQRVASAVLRLRDFYLTLGYPKVRVVSSIEPQGADVAVHFRIDEGALTILREVRIEGAVHTRVGVLRSRAGLVPGHPLDPRDVVAAERRLLSLGTLAGVTSTIGADGVVTLHVREAARFMAGYELAYDNDQGAQGEVNGQVRNLFGIGLVLGGGTQRGADQNRSYALVNMPLRTGLLTLSGARLSEDLGSTTRVQSELRLQQTLELRRPWKLLGSYRFKRVSLFDADGLPFVLPLNLSGLEPTLIRDNRDNQLDPRAGRFYSVDVEFDSKRLGSDLGFVKSLLLARLYRTRGAWTWAQGYTLGLGWGLDGQRIVSTERFTAGGANSLRGFATNSLGPADGTDTHGGEAAVVFNQEMRWRHRTGLGAALFYDGGNVFDRAADLSLHWRHSAGFGARYASPIGLLRLDLGVPFGRRAGEDRYQLYFSLGQAF